MQNDTVHIAAIRRGDDEDLSDTFAGLADDLQAKGVAVRGLVQQRRYNATGALSRRLTVIGSDRGFGISQALGAGSRACSLDTAALADAAAWLQRFRAERPGLIIIDRFGPLEAKGRGFADEILAIVTDGIPLLTSVRPAESEAWEGFTGGLAERLPSDPAAITAWCRATIPG
ncbi:DUF2478 domain-containing protein [Arhodomonas aquaeolei]|uniref:DUF2478 domain-containing protein n=1 Tax=Arhodomonas aquaeolei TaxID=2369 RepID=UPI002166DE6C|nr:DUF2478 domain-containing protein [Arhodomonas aquaeolei]MCS4503576.1 DUF2478 domain-containing protein [Arhodomonas aquaeolei]